MSDKPASEALRQFNRVSNARGFFDLTRHYASISALIWLACQVNNVVVTTVVVLLVGTLQYGLSCLQHEAWHYLCFRSHKFNDFIGSWFYTYALGGLYYFNQTRHRGHHAYFGTEQDPDRETYVNVQKETPKRCINFFIGVFFGKVLIDRVLLVVNRKVASFSATLPGLDLKSKNMPDTKTEFKRVVFAQLLIVLVFAATGNFWNYFLYWLLPLATVAVFLGTWRQFIEHANPKGDDVFAEERLFEFDANILERFFVCPMHFHLHAFHHTFPKIPHYRLKPAKKMALAQGLHYRHINRKGYVAVSLEHLRSLQTKLPLPLQNNFPDEENVRQLSS